MNKANKSIPETEGALRASVVNGMEGKIKSLSQRLRVHEIRRSLRLQKDDVFRLNPKQRFSGKQIPGRNRVIFPHFFVEKDFTHLI